VEQGIARWSDAAKVPVTVQYTPGNWMARDPKRVAEHPCSMSLATPTGWTPGPVPRKRHDSRLMPNAISTGPAIAWQEVHGPQCAGVPGAAGSGTDMQMFTEMLVRIGNLQQMQ
jgi:hypothetical protein